MKHLVDRCGGHRRVQQRAVSGAELHRYARICVPGAVTNANRPRGERRHLQARVFLQLFLVFVPSLAWQILWF